MITARKLEDGGVDLVIEAIQPNVYIDLDSLADISATESRRTKFLTTLDRRYAAVLVDAPVRSVGA